MLRKKGWLLFVFVFLFGAGCGGSKEKGSPGQMSVYDVNLCFTEEGVAFQDPNQGAVTGYFDYKTGEYMPLCAKANCLHDFLDCQAVYLNEYADFFGRIGDKWYYHVIYGEGVESGFHSCDLDGGNDRLIGEFPYLKGVGVVLFYDQVCVLDTWDARFDEETEKVTAHTSGIYRYHLDTGEWDTLCPEKESEYGPCYRLYGKYGDSLFYSEWNGKKDIFKQMDLKTLEVTEPFGDTFSYGAHMAENVLLCWSQEKGDGKLIEWDLETGERKEFPKKGGNFFWSQDFKVSTEFAEEFSDESFWTYQYKEDGTCRLVRQGRSKEEYFIPIAKSGSRILGQTCGKIGGLQCTGLYGRGRFSCREEQLDGCDRGAVKIPENDA